MEFRRAFTMEFTVPLTPMVMAEQQDYFLHYACTKADMTLSDFLQLVSTTIVTEKTTTMLFKVSVRTTWI
jgi:hypothetical protein